MYRFALEYLKAWKSKPNRKPLLIRGYTGRSSDLRFTKPELFDI